MSNSQLCIGMLLFPRLTQLDLTGPFEVFARIPNTEVLLLAPSYEPISNDTGLTIVPTKTFEECPPLDILFIPGGPGITTPVEKKVYRDFIQKQAQNVKYLTAVCTGSLTLAALGLLKGYKATTHWLSLDFNYCCISILNFL